jgi:uncharacterized phage protein gp47/JayE
MPWPIPQPADIYARAGAAYVAAFPGFDPTQPNTVCGTTSRIVGMTGFDLYLYQGYIMNELFPDTSVDNLDRHAGIWGLTRIPSQAATGSIAWTGSNGTVLASGILLTDQFGNSYLTTDGLTVSGGSATLTLTAVSGGAQGNLATGAVLTPVSPVAGMAATAAVASPGLSGGAPAESDTALRARLLQRIRERGRGGNNADYVNWCEAASSAVAYVQAIPQWYGAGSVGIFLAGAGPSALSGPEVATVSAYLGALFAPGGVAPVTAYVAVFGATLYTLNATVHLNPDTSTIRAAATAAFQAWVETDAQIGGTMYVARMDAALEGASGEFSHDRTLPAADVVLGPGTIAVAGVLSFA